MISLSNKESQKLDFHISFGGDTIQPIANLTLRSMIWEIVTLHPPVPSLFSTFPLPFKRTPDFLQIQGPQTLSG